MKRVGNSNYSISEFTAGLSTKKKLKPNEEIDNTGENKPLQSNEQYESPIRWFNSDNLAPNNKPDNVIAGRDLEPPVKECVSGLPDLISPQELAAMNKRNLPEIDFKNYDDIEPTDKQVMKPILGSIQAKLSSMRGNDEIVNKLLDIAHRGKADGKIVDTIRMLKEYGIISVADLGEFKYNDIAKMVIAELGLIHESFKTFKDTSFSASLPIVLNQKKYHHTSRTKERQEKVEALTTWLQEQGIFNSRGEVDYPRLDDIMSGFSAFHPLINHIAKQSGASVTKVIEQLSSIEDYIKDFYTKPRELMSLSTSKHFNQEQLTEVLTELKIFDRQDIDLSKRLLADYLESTNLTVSQLHEHILNELPENSNKYAENTFRKYMEELYGASLRDLVSYERVPYKSATIKAGHLSEFRNILISNNLIEEQGESLTWSTSLSKEVATNVNKFITDTILPLIPENVIFTTEIQEYAKVTRIKNYLRDLGLLATNQTDKNDGFVQKGSRLRKI